MPMCDSTAIALDTGVLATLLTGQPAEAHLRVVARLNRPGDFVIPVTVLFELGQWLEAEGYSRSDIIRALTLIDGLPNLRCLPYVSLDRIIAQYRAGLDFADAMHIATSLNGYAIATLDPVLAERGSQGRVRARIDLI